MGFLSFSQVVVAGPRIDLRELLPENNNACPTLSPIPFRAVVLNEGLSCADTTGVRNIMSKLGAWMPPRATKPRLALVLTAEDDNAYYSGYALNVPLRLKGSLGAGRSARYFPNDISRGVVAHEYGHAMLNSALASRNAEFREELALMTRLGEHMAIQQVVQLKYLREYRMLEQSFTRKYGPKSKWTAEQAREFEATVVRLSKKYEPQAQLNDKLLQEAGSKVSEHTNKHFSILSSYHEFFADLVAVLDGQDWALTGKIISILVNDRAAGLPRDFTNAGNAFENVARVESHELLGPARYALYQRLKSKRCLRPDPKLLIPAVIDAIHEQSRTAWGSSEVSTVAGRIAFNRAFVNSIFWRLDRLGAGLCRAR
ncbi:MAG: hypothetical protein A2X94_12295 [Bdellovibrionales bacterium GWB1_55_8]|nr:MAG: hypothetical protein A2X94_12295 [Bdellovibrionales bacterium GWB1_55_8]